MTGQGFLDQIEKLETMIVNKKTEKKMWEDVAKGVTPNYCGERVRSTGDGQKMSEAVNKIVDICQEIDKVTKELIGKMNEIIAAIEKLPNEEYNVLHQIYIQKLTTKEVAAVCKKSPSWVKSVRANGVKHLEELIKNKGGGVDPPASSYPL